MFFLVLIGYLCDFNYGSICMVLTMNRYILYYYIYKKQINYLHHILYDYFIYFY